MELLLDVFSDRGVAGDAELARTLQRPSKKIAEGGFSTSELSNVRSAVPLGPCLRDLSRWAICGSTVGVNWSFGVPCFVNFVKDWVYISSWRDGTALNIIPKGSFS
jgi:hypothetical protein